MAPTFRYRLDEMPFGAMGTGRCYFVPQVSKQFCRNSGRFSHDSLTPMRCRTYKRSGLFAPRSDIGMPIYRLMLSLTLFQRLT